MRILVFGPNYAPEKTGTGKYTAEMAEWFAARGHDVEVITGPPHYPEWKIHAGHANRHTDEMLNGVKVRRVPMFIPPPGGVTSKRRIRMESSFSLHAARPWFRRLLRKQKPDVIIAVCPPMQVGAWASLYSRLRRVPWVFHIQDLQVDAAVRLGMLKPSGFTKMLYRLEETFLKRATRVSTITPGMAKRIEEKGVDPNRILLVPNWSDIQTMRPGPRMNSFRSEVGAGTDDILLLYAGNMGRKQGLEIILQAARSLDDPRLKFVLVGDGAARPELEKEARGLANVQFLDLQPWERVPEMLNAANIHLVVQKREAADLVMPSKLTNILAVGGCALATADSGTLGDVLREAGFLVAPEDAVALLTGIETLANDPALREDLSRKARTYAESHLDRDAILQRFESLLATLAT